MKIKTSELTGAALDWVVGDIEFERLIAQGSWVKQWVLDDHKAGRRTDPYSRDWIFGGPIIEREHIDLSWQYGGRADWSAWIDSDLEHSTSNVYDGPTPLIAAMRCYVANELGEEVDVPEELL